MVKPPLRGFKLRFAQREAALVAAGGLTDATSASLPSFCRPNGI